MPPWLERARHWSRTIAEFAVAQGLGQAAGMLAGLIYVRTMPVEQYALYALCLTALGVIAVGSDLGLTGSLGYFWRKSLQDGTPIAPKVALVQRLRGYLFVASTVIAGAMLATSVGMLPITGFMIALSVSLMVATAWVQVRTSVDILLVRLEGRQRASYVYETAGSFVRLAAAAIMLLSGLGAAWFGLAGGLMGALATMALLQRNSPRDTQATIAANASDWIEMRAYLLPLLPSVLVYMIQDPLILWLAAVRSGPAPVAEMHALGRIVAIFAVIGTFSYVVMTPRLARISDNRRYFLTTCVFLAAVTAAALATVLVVRAYPDKVLLLIGDRYAHLGAELVLLLIASSVAMLTWFLNLANRGRGWIALEPFMATAQMLAIVVLCMNWRFDRTTDLILLTLVLNSTALCASAFTFLTGVFRPELVVSSQSPKKDKR